MPPPSPLRSIFTALVCLLTILAAILASQTLLRAPGVLRYATTTTLRSPPHRAVASILRPHPPRSPLLTTASALFSQTISFARTYVSASTIRFPSQPHDHQQPIMATTTTASAPKPPQAPPLFDHTKDNLYSRFEALARETKELNDAQVANIKPEDATWENTWLPRIWKDQRHSLESRIIEFYHYVSSDPALREESIKGSEMLEKAGIEQNMRLDVYQRFSNVYNNRDSFGLDPESLRFLDKDHRGFIKMGLGLPEGAERDRFKAIKERLTELVTQFQKTLNEENGGLWLTPDELDGMPADDLGRLEKGTGENEGKLRLTFKYPDLHPALSYIKDSAVRHRIQLADQNKCNTNAPLMKELIVLRDEAARILGYPSHAAMRIEDRMAKLASTVTDFLGNLRDRLGAAGKEQVAQLYELKKADLTERGLPEEPDLYSWDWRYYDRLLIEKEYSVEQNKVAEYFPLNSTVTGMLRIFEKLFGLRFFQLGDEDKAALSPNGKAADLTWHPDVIMFSVFDDEEAGGDFVGYLYLDLHPRPGKYTHAANFGIQDGYQKEDGSRHYPCTALVCNFSPPTANKPSLLKHSEVNTFFHELGHGIHSLVGKTRYVRFHGTSTARDFVEAPSQMLENWCWTPGVLKSLSKHWDTAESIPDDLIEKLVKTHHVHQALATLRQLHFGLFDMAVHDPKSHEAVKALEPGPLFNKLRGEIVPIKGEETFGKGYDFGHGEATFGHLAGGYDAGYYGYLYSLVFSADMWHTAFKPDPMDGKVGRLYRKIVLERGGSREEMDNLVEFLGREPNAEAFYKDLGITN